MSNLRMPTNPVLLLSLVNTKLRDFYSSVEDLCEDLNWDQTEIIRLLQYLGMEYHKEQNQFR